MNYKDANLLSTKGRVARVRFGLEQFIFITLGSLSLRLCDKAAFGALYFYVGLVLTFLFFSQVFCIYVRRWHDFGYGGIYGLVFLILYIDIPHELLNVVLKLATLIIVLIAQFKPGDKEENKYGPPPPAPKMKDKIFLALTIFISILLY